MPSPPSLHHSLHIHTPLTPISTSNLDRQREIDSFKGSVMFLLLHQLIIVLVSIVLLVCLLVRTNSLSYNYYENSCPNVEIIVKNTILPIFLTDLTAPAALLRLLFHDCQVQGCDASILLDFETLEDKSEMFSPKNFMIRHQKSIEEIKSVLESVCPGQVSCADIIALAAKESVAFSGGPQIQIPLGRKDSTTKSSYRDADISLPSSKISVDEMLQIFKSKGMNLVESVAILGAHTLGVGHCMNIVDRLYSQKGNDNSFANVQEKAYEVLLRLKCPTKVPLTNLTFVSNDLTPVVFDNQYYQDILNGRGLFSIDSNIARDPRTATVVRTFAEDRSYFFQVFSSAFVKLSLSNILTGQKGQIRRDCTRVN